MNLFVFGASCYDPLRCRFHPGLVCCCVCDYFNVTSTVYNPTSVVFVFAHGGRENSVTSGNDYA